MATTKTGTAIDASGNAVDVTVTTLANGSLADANDVMATLNDIETDLEGHSHSLDGAVGWDSLLASYRPPDTGDSTNRWRLVSGQKAVSVAASDQGTATLTYATDADQGDPSFTEAPRVLASSANNPNYMAAPVGGVATITTLAVTHVAGTVATNTINVNWTAYGKVA